VEKPSDHEDKDDEIPAYDPENYGNWIIQYGPRFLQRWEQQPFSQRLDVYLQRAWAQRLPNRHLHRAAEIALGYMVRDEDIPIVQKYIDQHGAQEKALNLYWNSGLFDQAKALFKYLPADIRNRVRAELDLCRGFSKLGIWGRCEAMLDLFRLVDRECKGIRAYPNQLPNLLIVGQTGTGKEKLASAIHTLTGRGEYRPINCADFTSNPDLMRSELYGHVKGAFTGATQDKKGLLEVCRDNGTLLFDEINSLAPGLQGDLLRLLQERKFRRVGGTEEFPVDTLLIAATNQDLSKLVEEEKFREDLFSRLSEVTIQIPSLKDRFGDIPLLVNQTLLGYGPTRVDDGRDELAAFLGGQFYSGDPPGHAGGNIRWLEQEVGRWVRLNVPVVSSAQSPQWQAINRAIEEAMKDGMTLPLSRRKVARRMRWKDRQGVSPSLLSDPNWKPVVEKFVQEGTIRG